MAAKKMAPVGDLTRTARAKSHIQRLEDAGGKRIVTDFNAEGFTALQQLLNTGYGETQRDVVIRAVIEASNRNTT